MRLCRDVDDAHDLVQETYLRALTCASRFAAGTNSAAWLITISRRLFIDEWRRRRRSVLVPLSDADHVAVAPREDEDAGWTDISAVEVEAAIAALSPPFREVFELHALQRRSYREIGAHLGIPVATVGTRLARARRKIKAMLTVQERAS